MLLLIIKTQTIQKKNNFQTLHFFSFKWMDFILKKNLFISLKGIKELIIQSSNQQVHTAHLPYGQVLCGLRRQLQNMILTFKSYN